ncbi:MAG: cell division protein FtsA, partial [Candidatus Marinimicrobia bacterium]|nr:cell division protein FtsA [Candidatus Neomarinimicrobiota bacterium]
IHIGLDIGTSKVCAIAAEPDQEGTLKVVGVSTSPSTGLRRGTIVDIEATARAIRQALDEIEASVGIKAEQVTVGIAGEHIYSLNATGVIGIADLSKRGHAKELEITEEDVERVIESAKAVGLPNGRQIIHVIPQQFAVDDESGLRNPVGMNGRRLEAQVHLVTSATSSTKNIISTVRHAGCNVKDFVLEPIASAQSVLTEEEKQIGVGLIDIGAGTTDAIVLSKFGVEHTVSLPYGGNQVTTDIAGILRITEEQADELKLKYGHSFTDEAAADKVFDVKGVGGREDRNMNEVEFSMYIEARMDEILKMVQSNFRESGMLKHLNSGIVLTGGGSNIPGIVSLTKRVFEMPVRLGNPIGFNDTTELIQSPEYATATGLIAYAAKFQSEHMPRFESGSLSGVLGKIKDFFKNNF